MFRVLIPAALGMALWLAPASAQVARFEWLGDIDAVLPAIAACAEAHPEKPVGVAALDRAAWRLSLRDPSGLIWSCRTDARGARAELALEPDPASVRHRRPVFWPARFGEPWAECWDAEPVRARDGTLAGWFVFVTC
ncbi:MAG: hypothetical protein ING19_12350 [Azospirillum sp.]|nr:hypothetical protein [Azospirillum sp.]MCA3266848.1 hypothetical protein [Azospirillum sp.]MCZ8122149.1 hypothetical protein [Magnetospirillum sp.]